MFDLTDKVCVVTGAAGVLCSSMVEALVAHGAKVALIGRTTSKLEALAADLAEHHPNCQVLPVSADVLDKAGLEAAKERINAELGRVDVLINGAGGNHPKGTTPAEQMTAETPLDQSFFGAEVEGFEHVFKLNFLGTLLPCQVFGADMHADGGSIINISSMSAQNPLTKVAAYSAAKAAVDNFTKWLATHFAAIGIRVNAIAPGFFITEQNRFLLLEQDGETLTARGNKIIQGTPMARFGEPEDLQSATVFLAADSARFITGTVIPVDGGYGAYSGV
jgi:NAD(P)-dependent dehydrogenase (short-subunit alcohol dehydrogenase family)